ncbi:MAG: hypothetical protein QMC78_03000 [Methanocellales archaeon]|nr:hypothetical protein [Methanocellales archaeon]
MGIKISRPCSEDPNEFIAEGSFGRSFSMRRLCSLLKKHVTDLKCSESLGVAKFEMDGRTVMLYRNGRIDIRRVKDLRDAKAIMTKIREMTNPAFE